MLFLMLTFGPRFGNVPWVALPLGVMLLGVLHLNFATVIPRYQLTDHLGQESSFPFVGGSVEFFCIDGSDKRDVMNMTADPSNTKTHVKLKKNMFPLEPGFVGTIYGCKDVIKTPFELGLLHCDPFAIMPKVTCKDNQWCLIGKTGQARCETKNNKYCFFVKPYSDKQNIETFLPKLRTACVNLGRNGNNDTDFGLCDANAQNKPVFGLAEAPVECQWLQKMTLNNITVTHEKVILVPSNTKTWKIDYNDEYREVTCKLVDSTKTTVQIPKYKESKTFVPKLGNNKLPIKIQLICSIPASKKKGNSISAFIIVYNSNPSEYSVKMSKKNLKGKIELSCVCKVPDPFVCGLTWDKPKQNEELTEYPREIKKQLTRKEHNTAVEYNCYLQVLAYDFPNSFKLIRVPLATEYLQENITVSAHDFDTPNSGTDSSGNKDGTGSGESGSSGKKTSNGDKSKDDSPQANSKSDASTIALAVSMVVLAVLIASGIILGVGIFMRHRKRTRLAEAEELRREQSELGRRKDMSFIDSIRDSPNKVDAAFLGLFFEERKSISQRIRDTGGLLYRYYKNIKKFQIITTFWDSFNAYVPGEVKSLSTTRYENKLLISTWLFKDHVTTPTTKAKSSRKPEVLHVSILTDIFMVPRFLASQAPLLSEMALFLQTIVDQGVTLVVCLLAEHELRDTPEVNGKYFDYLTLTVGEAKTYGDLTLFCVSIFPTAHFITREVEIKLGDNVHRMHIVRYLGWPDHGVGPPAHLLELCQGVRNFERALPGKTLVHCAGGIGRTGCLIASLQCLQLYDFQGLPFDISAVCLKVRKERHQAIQQFNQYAMVFWVVAAYGNRNLRKLAPIDNTIRQLTIKQELTARPKEAKDAESPVAKDKHRSSASSAPKVTPSKQRRESKSTK